MTINIEAEIARLEQMPVRELREEFSVSCSGRDTSSLGFAAICSDWFVCSSHPTISNRSNVTIAERN